MDQSAIQQIKLRYGIVGNCEALNRAIEIALKIAPVDLSVLVTGENGVGKEAFPKIIHDHSARKNRKYFAVNCGAIPEGTIDSELFGHEKGAFTGAVDQREGYFAAANGGTLFLDEVGELPMQTQARLLRVLESGEYIRVGSSEVRKTDVRIVAATNVNMRKAIEDGRFRQDLYYRLNTVSISVPPLRERGGDAVLLFRKFALEMSEKYKMPAVRLTPEAQRSLLAYSWPGNVRQLKNLAENMSVTAEERDITPEILAAYLPQEARHTDIVAVNGAKENRSFETEREFIYQILLDLRREVSELKQYVHERQTDKAIARQEKNSRSDLLFEGGASVKMAPETAPDVPYWEAEEVKDEEAGASQKALARLADMKGEGTTSKLLRELNRETITLVLKEHHGRRKEAADELGISERTLYRKIKEYGLE